MGRTRALENELREKFSCLTRECGPQKQIFRSSKHQFHSLRTQFVFVLDSSDTTFLDRFPEA